MWRSLYIIFTKLKKKIYIYFVSWYLERIFFACFFLFTFHWPPLVSYPKDPQIVPYLLATLKCSHALTSWTYADFLKLNNSLGQVVIQSKKIRTSPTQLGERAIQSCQGVWHYSWVFRGKLQLH